MILRFDEDLEFVPIAGVAFTDIDAFLRVLVIDRPEGGDFDLVVVFILLPDDLDWFVTIVPDKYRGALFVTDESGIAMAVVVGFLRPELHFAVDGFAAGVE